MITNTHVAKSPLPKELLATIDDEAEAAGASKLQALIEQLQDIGVGPRSPTRVVVFSERIATLDWLAEMIPAALKLKDKHVQVLQKQKKMQQPQLKPKRSPLQLLQNSKPQLQNQL